jgi:hypothetical protein
VTHEREKLDAAKRRFLDAKDEIEKLRLEIALKECPLKLGDRISIIDNGKEYEGVVERIDGACDDTELLDPVVGATTGWAVSGNRIKKTDGGPSSWSFGFTSFNASFHAGKWIVEERSIEAALGLKPLT